MSNKKTNHKDKEELGCVLGRIFKRYHKTSKLVQKYDTQHAFLSKIIKQSNKYQEPIKEISRQSSMTPNKGNDMHIHEILKVGWWRAYLGSKLSASWRKKY